jgi:hypothetical protein
VLSRQRAKTIHRNSERCDMIANVLVINWAAEETASAASRVGELLDRLAAEVPGVVSAHHGSNIGIVPTAQSYGVCLLYADMPAFERYLAHPAHSEIVECLANSGATFHATQFSLAPGEPAE